MKKFILIISIIFFSCSNDQNCDKQLKDLDDKYKSSIQNAGSSNSAFNEITRQYQSQRQSILNNCK